MFSNFIFYSKYEIEKLTRKREWETKIGETIAVLPQTSFESETSFVNTLLQLHAKYVLLGIPEDIGVKANLGRGGAYSAWQPTLESILNTQSNVYFSGEALLVLGHFFWPHLIQQGNELDNKNTEHLQKLRSLVDVIDEEVTQLCVSIFKAGKIPIVVGGGHNNSYPLLKAAYTSNNVAVQCLNIDPHCDFRPLEGRHSGNGFSYAYNKKYLQKYFVAGIHESYNSSSVLQQFISNPNLGFFTYDSVEVRQEATLTEATQQCISFFDKAMPLALEIDLDAIQNVPSSAKTSSGFQPIDVRKILSQMAQQFTVMYLHIAEGAPVLSHIKTDNKTGKLISYLIIDFIKSHIKS
jgi:formiminoglutamase